MKKNYFIFLISSLMFVVNSFGQLGTSHFLYPNVTEINREYHAAYVETPPVIDGDVSDEAWNLVQWGLAQTYTTLLGDWDGAVPVAPEGEFSGEADYKLEYKMLYDDSTYYLLLKISDDNNIYSDYHAGYPGKGPVFNLWYPSDTYADSKAYWNQFLRPSVGGGDGSGYDAWRMDQVQFFLAANKPAFVDAFNRNDDGVFTNFYPGAVNSTNDTAVLAAQKSSVSLYTLDIAGSQDGNVTFIEFKDTTWTGMFPNDRSFVAMPGDTLQINMEINDADGTTNRGDYKMYLSTTEGKGWDKTLDWVKVVLDAPPVTVFDIIAKSADHDTLEAAVLASGLDVSLKGDGPFTVFAPTDNAFAALPEGTLDALLADPFGALAGVLGYHVVSGSATMAADLTDGMTLTTLKGTDVSVRIDGAVIYINDVEVIVSDLEADNGVVHVLDAVLTDRTGISTQKTGFEFMIYPNPISDGLLKINKISNVSIFDITGRETMNVKNVNQIDISNLSSGVYFVKDEGGNVLRLVKE